MGKEKNEARIRLDIRSKPDELENDLEIGKWSWQINKGKRRWTLKT